MAQTQTPQASQLVGWDRLTHSHMSVMKLFFLYALPLSLVPPVMIHYAGVTYGGHVLPLLNEVQLTTIGFVFFIAELAMTYIVATIIQHLAQWVEIDAAFEDCYKVAVVAPTPLWLAPLFLYIPSFIVNITVISLALIFSGMLLFYSVPAILKIEEKGHAILLSGSILSVGLVAWAMMMYIALLSWSFAGSTLLLMV